MTRDRLRSMRALGVLFLFTGCSFLIPTTWRAFSADPDDAAPAITRALDARNLDVADWNQAEHRIVTGWVDHTDGVKRVHQRFVVTWERDETEKALTIYVRHEGQEQELDEGRPVWGSVFHDTSQETGLLDEITKELAAMRKPMETDSAQ